MAHMPDVSTRSLSKSEICVGGVSNFQIQRVVSSLSLSM